MNKALLEEFYQREDVSLNHMFIPRKILNDELLTLYLLIEDREKEIYRMILLQ